MSALMNISVSQCLQEFAMQVSACQLAAVESTWTVAVMFAAEVATPPRGMVNPLANTLLTVTVPATRPTESWLVPSRLSGPPLRLKARFESCSVASPSPTCRVVAGFTAAVFLRWDG